MADCSVSSTGVVSNIGCRYEYTVGVNGDADANNNNPLFVETATGTAGKWKVSVDLAKYVQPTSTGLAALPTLISSGKVKKIEISVLPSLTVAGESVALKAANGTYSVTPTAIALDRRCA